VPLEEIMPNAISLQYHAEIQDLHSFLSNNLANILERKENLKIKERGEEGQSLHHNHQWKNKLEFCSCYSHNLSVQ